MRMMGDKILVAYATRYGSTREVAEVAGAALREQGVDADVKAAKDVTALGGYGGVVLATPFYIGSMLKEATQFLERNRAALEVLPVALLTLGPVQASDDMAEARKQLDDALAKLEWLEPVVAEMFVGKYDPAHLRLLDKLVALPPASPLHGVGAHDDRDWESIRAWAEALPAAIGVA
jgi:menaquinone-dependent protoporphyrinogen oxidase